VNSGRIRAKRRFYRRSTRFGTPGALAESVARIATASAAPRTASTDHHGTEATDMNDPRLTERLRRLFGIDPAPQGVGSAPLGAAILSMARAAADMHREMGGSLDESSGGGVWPEEGLLTVAEFAALHGIDLDSLDAEVRS